MKVVIYVEGGYLSIDAVFVDLDYMEPCDRCLENYHGGIERHQTTYGEDLFIHHENGRAAFYCEDPEGGSNQPARWLYEYSFKDHLGNTRLTIADLNGDGYIQTSGEDWSTVPLAADYTEILQEGHYYPFGMQMAGPWNQPQAPQKENKYLYNGKEYNEDLGLNWSDYGARWYDAAIGRWNGVDPLAREYAAWSPYCYALDNPILFIDPDGKDPEPTNSLISKWFLPRIEMIKCASEKYNIDPKLIGAVLFRENQNFMSKDKIWTRAWIAKESLAMIRAYSLGSDPEEFETWSSGITQMQVKLVVMMKYDMSEVEYENAKSHQGEFQKLLGNAAEVFNSPEEGIDLLAKYIGKLTKYDPNLTPEQAIEDYARGLENSRDPKKPLPQSLKEDIDRYKEFKSHINKLLEDEEK
jgi:RHS repeat-associated protein